MTARSGSAYLRSRCAGAGMVRVGEGPGEDVLLETFEAGGGGEGPPLESYELGEGEES